MNIEKEINAYASEFKSDSLWFCVNDYLWYSVMNSVMNSVGNSVWASVEASVVASINNAINEYEY